MVETIRSFRGFDFAIIMLRLLTAYHPKEAKAFLLDDRQTTLLIDTSCLV